jgi:putative acetyltransferase
VIVRRYRPSDREVARRIQAEAFRRDSDSEPVPEAVLFDALLDDGDVIDALSFVVEVEGVPVGHVVCSRATVDVHPVAALGPIGVLPARQGNGIGSALVHAALAAADELELPLVALLGSPAYYARFGFVPGSGLGIEPPDPSWGAYFQVRTLDAYAPDVRGAFSYAPAFALVS